MLAAEAFNEDIADEWSELERNVYEPERTLVVETQRSDGGRPGHRRRAAAYTRT